MPLPGRSFSSLMAELALEMGQTAGPESEGFEFDCEGVTVRLLPHPSQPEQALLEADVQALSESEQGDARLLLMLHQLNETSSWSSGWLALIDLEAHLLLRRILTLEGMRAPDLQGQVLEALDRAQALQGLLRDIQASESRKPEMTLPAGMQRV